MDLVVDAMEEGRSVSSIARECEVSPSWLHQWLAGTYTDVGLHRIGRILERLG